MINIDNQELFDTHIITPLKQWREARHITRDMQLKAITANILEELTEYLRATNNHESINALCDMAIFSLNGMKYSVGSYMFFKRDINSKENRKVSIQEDILKNIRKIEKYKRLGFDSSEAVIFDDYLIEIVIDSLSAIQHLGYEPFNCLAETIKEIQSRTGMYNEALGKWIKDSNTERYIPDYEKYNTKE